MDKQEFYEGKDSCFIRIQYIEATNSFRLLIRNELMLSTESENEGAILVGNIARGLLELCYADPRRTHGIGESATYRDMIAESAEDLDDYQKRIWFGPMESDSIN